MDCEFNNTSDILFPSDTGLPKLASPLDYKIPEAIDWASQDFMFTFHDKSTNELNNFLCFKRYIPVQPQEQEQQEEKQILSQMNQRLAVGNTELHDSLKAFFHSIQSSMQLHSQPELVLPGLSWAEEANEYYGGNDIGNLDSVQELEGKRTLVAPVVDDDDDVQIDLSAQSSLSDINMIQDKPLPPLPKNKKSVLLKKFKTKTKKVIRKLFHVS